MYQTQNWLKLSGSPLLWRCHHHCLRSSNNDRGLLLDSKIFFDCRLLKCWLFLQRHQPPECIPSSVGVTLRPSCPSCPPRVLPRSPCRISRFGKDQALHVQAAIPPSPPLYERYSLTEAEIWELCDLCKRPALHPSTTTYRGCCGLAPAANAPLPARHLASSTWHKRTRSRLYLILPPN